MSKDSIALWTRLYEVCKKLRKLNPWEFWSSKDIILIEGYKKSNLRKIEVFRSGVSEKIITPKEKIIAVASDINIDIDDIIIVDREDYKKLADLIEKEKEFSFENYQ